VEELGGDIDAGLQSRAQHAINSQAVCRIGDPVTPSYPVGWWAWIDMEYDAI